MDCVSFGKWLRFIKDRRFILRSDPFLSSSLPIIHYHYFFDLQVDKLEKEKLNLQSEYERSLQTKNDELVDIQQKLESALEDNRRVKELESACRSFEERIASMVENREELTVQLERVQKDLVKSATELRTRSVSYENEIGKWKERAKSVEEMNKKNQAHEEKNIKLAKMNSALKEKLRAVSEKHVDSSAKVIEELTQKVTCYELQLGDLDALRGKVEHLRGLEDKLRNLELINSQLMKEKSNLLSEFDKSKFRNSELVSLVQTLEAEGAKRLDNSSCSSTTSQMSKDLEDKLNCRNEKLSQLEKKVACNKVNVSKLEQLLGVKERAIANLEGELKGSQTRVLELTSENALLRCGNVGIQVLPTATTVNLSNISKLATVFGFILHCHVFPFH